MKPLWAVKAAYYANGEGACWDLFDALQFSFFSTNKNIELDEVIYENVKKIGIKFEEWKDFYLSDQVKEAVEADLKRAETYGLHGVPALVINGDTVVNGAVSLAQIKQVIEKVNQKNNTVLSTKDACETDGSR